MIDYDNFCKICNHYKYDISTGILCGLTNAKPAFNGECTDFSKNPEKEKSVKETSTKTYSQINDTFSEGERVATIGGGLFFIILGTVLTSVSHSIWIGMILVGGGMLIKGLFKPSR